MEEHPHCERDSTAEVRIHLIVKAASKCLADRLTYRNSHFITIHSLLTICARFEVRSKALQTNPLVGDFNLNVVIWIKSE